MTAISGAAEMGRPSEEPFVNCIHGLDNPRRRNAHCGKRRGGGRSDRQHEVETVEEPFTQLSHRTPLKTMASRSALVETYGWLPNGSGKKRELDVSWLIPADEYQDIAVPYE